MSIYYMPEDVLGAADTAVNKALPSPSLHPGEGSTLIQGRRPLLLWGPGFAGSHSVRDRGDLPIQGGSGNVGAGVGGCWAGTQALAPLPDRPALAAPWSAISTPWWPPWSRWPANPTRAGRDTWRGWRKYTARCWGRRRPPGGAAAVSGRGQRGPARARRGRQRAALHLPRVAEVGGGPGTSRLLGAWGLRAAQNLGRSRAKKVDDLVTMTVNTCGAPPVPQLLF